MKFVRAIYNQFSKLYIYITYNKSGSTICLRVDFAYCLLLCDPFERCIMLKIVNSMRELSFSQLMNIYSEGNREYGAELYPHLSDVEQVQEAEQDFYQYLQDIFFRQKGSFYGLWEVSGVCRTALRIEPYADGVLLCALETEPGYRRKGYASALICAVLDYLFQLGSPKIYSHVSKKNLPSLLVHKKCGFEIIMDHAVYSDGSVVQSSYTLCYNIKKSET